MNARVWLTTGVQQRARHGGGAAAAASREHDAAAAPWEAEPQAPGRCNTLLGGASCHTLYDMKNAAVTIRLDRDLERQLARAAKRSGRSRSAIVRDALRRQLAIAQFQDLRRRILPLAEAAGLLTDEDVFRDVS